MEMVEVGGLQIAYERAGSGPALVLLHGYVGDGPTTWRRQLDGLSDEFTVVAWDAPGASGSRLVVLPDAGHLCNIEAPDEFSTAVRNFLQESRR